MALLNWDDTGGLYVPAGQLKSVSEKDTITKANSWKYPVKGKQSSAGPDAFIHWV